MLPAHFLGFAEHYHSQLKSTKMEATLMLTHLEKRQKKLIQTT